MKKTGARQRRELLRKTHWPNEDVWLGGKDETGWFSVPRTLPLILDLLDSKPVSGSSRPSTTYLELLSRHWGEGVVEMKHEGQHAYGAGHHGNRAIRTWREHMQILEDNGFIKTLSIGGQEFGYVLIVHPTIVVERMRREKKILDPKWLAAYKDRQLESKELSFEERKKVREQPGKVVSIKKAADTKPSTQAVDEFIEPANPRSPG
jgi:hypothetical protein